MKHGHEPDRPAEMGFDALPEERMDALRASIQRFLSGEPARDERGLELYLVQVEAAILSYLGPEPVAARAGEADRRGDSMDRQALALEFDSLAAGARSLASTVEALSAYSRDRLTETTRLDREALDHLLRLCSLAESEAGTTRAQLMGEPHPTRPTSASAELVLLEELAVVWTRHTDERILRDREARSPWARFVEVACDIAGIEHADAHRIRVRLFDSAGVSESAELLESVPDL